MPKAIGFLADAWRMCSWQQPQDSLNPPSVNPLHVAAQLVRRLHVYDTTPPFIGGLSRYLWISCTKHQAERGGPGFRSSVFASSIASRLARSFSPGWVNPFFGKEGGGVNYQVVLLLSHLGMPRCPMLGPLWPFRGVIQEKVRKTSRNGFPGGPGPVGAKKSEKS